jgi:hypothetical protein
MKEEQFGFTQTTMGSLFLYSLAIKTVVTILIINSDAIDLLAIILVCRIQYYT